MANNRFDIELLGVSKSYGTVAAVDNISFSVVKGEFFSLLGPSGCGKSTTLRMIAGFEWPSRGEIIIQGRPMHNVPPNRRPTNLVFQNLALFPLMSVFDNIAFGLTVRHLPRVEVVGRVRTVLDIVNLRDYEGKRIDQLSGGERQRVAIARALVLDPAVLLLDEPLGPLDLNLRQQMKLELKRLHERVGTTFVYVTHDQSEAMVMSDRIAVMNRGRVVQIGTPEEIYEHPVTPFVARFIGEANEFAGRVEKQDSDGLVVWVDGLGLIACAPLGRTFQRRLRVFIRPERVQLGEERSENTFHGAVEEIIYEGQLTKCLVRLRDGARVLVTAKGGEGHSCRRGDSILVSWSRQDIIVLEEGES